MFSFTTFVLWLHFIGIAFWTERAAFYFLIVKEVLTKPVSSPTELVSTIEAILRRSRSFSGELIFFIILTGIFNLINAGYAIEFNFSATYIKVLALKVSLFIALIVIQAIYNFTFLPSLISAANIDWEPTQLPEVYSKLRRTANIYFVLYTTCVLAALFLGLGLRYA